MKRRFLCLIPLEIVYKKKKVETHRGFIYALFLYTEGCFSNHPRRRRESRYPLRLHKVLPSASVVYRSLFISPSKLIKAGNECGLLLVQLCCDNRNGASREQEVEKQNQAQLFSRLFIYRAQ